MGLLLARFWQSQRWGILLALLLAVQAMPLSGRQLVEDFSDDADPSQPGLAAAGFSHQFGPNPPGGSTFWFLTSGAAGDHSLVLAPATDAVQFQLLPGEVVDQASVEIVDFNGATEVTFVGATDSMTIPVNNVTATLVASALDSGAGGQALGPLQSIDIVSFEGAVDDIVIDTRFTVGADLGLTQTIAVPPRDGARMVVQWSLHNAGPDLAVDPTVVANIAAPLSFVVAVSDSRCTLSTQLRCDLADLPATGEDMVLVAFDVAAGSAGVPIDVGAGVVAASMDFNPANDTVQDTLIVGPPPRSDLELVDLGVAPEAPAEGEAVGFDVAVVNNGPDTASDVEIIVGTPTGSVLDGGASSAGCSARTDGSVRCVVGSLPAQSGASARVVAQVPFDQLSCTPVSAVVSAGSLDPVAGNNSLTRGFSTDDGSNFSYQLLASETQLARMLGAMNLRVQDLIVMSDSSVALIAHEGGLPPAAQRSWVVHWDAGFWQVLLDSIDYPGLDGEAMAFAGLSRDGSDRLYVSSAIVGDSPFGAERIELWVRTQPATAPGGLVRRLFSYRNPAPGTCDPCLADWDVSDAGHVVYLLTASGSIAMPNVGLRRIFYDGADWSSPNFIPLGSFGDILDVAAINDDGIAVVHSLDRRTFVVARDGTLIDEGSLGLGYWSDADLTNDLRLLTLGDDGATDAILAQRLQHNGLPFRAAVRDRGMTGTRLSSATRVQLDNAVYLHQNLSGPARPEIRISDIFRSGAVYRSPRCLFGQEVADVALYPGGANDGLVTAWLSQMQSQERWIMRAIPKDTDADGVADYEERSAFAGSDANNDGIEDHRQAEVVSTFSRLDGTPYSASFALPPPARFRAFHKVGDPPATGGPGGVRYPWLYSAFGIHGIDPGQEVAVSGRYVPPACCLNYHKYGATPVDLQPHWYPFDYDGDTGFDQQIGEDRTFRLHFRDGARGDGDLSADGVITDPGAMAAPGPLFADGMEALFPHGD